MKVFLSILVFISVCFEDRFKAAQSGDFKKAYDIWEPLANQGVLHPIYSDSFKVEIF